MKKSLKAWIVIGLIFTMVISTTACGTNSLKEDSVLDPENPVNIQVWNYYNGDQKIAFDKMVSLFNETVGLEKGIIVEAFSQGSIPAVVDELMDAIDQKAGAKEVPDLVAVYPETAFELESKGLLANLDDYFTKEELSEYVPEFIEEGRMKQGGALVNFPMSKSTEICIYNKTDWDKFQAATGVSIDEITSIEKLVSAGEKYYNWTDGLTPNVKEDGKALFGRDAMDNYMFIGSMQLGHELFTVTDDGVIMDIDRDTFKTLWKNYYIPMINGYAGAYGKYRSDDAKTGKILLTIGSSSSAGYFPEKVTLADDNSYGIQVGVMAAPTFEDAKDKYVVQQGAGYCVLKSGEQKQYASVEFLKWMTEAEQNVKFSIESGYMPVKIEANSEESISAAYEKLPEKQRNVVMKRTLIVGSDVMQKNKPYAAKPFQFSREVRQLLKSSMEERALKDRMIVEERVKSGMSRKEATAEFSTEAYFDAWFEELNRSVIKTIGDE